MTIINMTKSLKQQVVSGIIWDGFQKFGTMAITFVSNIILARLLMPEDFGTLGLIMVFIAISNAFVDSGFTDALIQKGNPTDEDYSSVFYFNLVISLLFYCLIFISSPYFSKFFHAPLLTNTLKVTGTILIFNAISIIQLTQLRVKLQFKKRSQYNIIATLIGTALGIILAFYDYGVWSLVYRTLATSLILCIIVWTRSKWIPILHFSFQRVKALFNFGGFMFLSTLIEYVYSNLQPIIIGKFFTIGQLGYFTQARKLEEIPSNTLTGIISSVTFPVYSKIKDDNEKLKRGAKSSLKTLSFLAIPLMTWMILLSHPLVILLFGEKWEESYKFLQILCIAGIFRIPSGINMNVIASTGRSKSFMFIQLMKRIFGIIVIIWGAQYGILGLMWGFALSSFIFFVIDSIACGKYVKYGMMDQLIDMLPNTLVTIAASVLVLCFNKFLYVEDSFMLIIFDTFVYISVLSIISYLFKIEALNTIIKLLQEKLIAKI